MAILLGACLLAALIVTAIHDETLRLLNRGLLPRVSTPRRWHVAGTVLVLIIAHVIEIASYAGIMYWLGVHWPDAPTLSGISTTDFMTYLYFSFSCYTSLGIGDLQPLSHLRLIAGTEALVGLLMIGWTASFLLLEMRALWSLNIKKTDKL